MANHLIAEQLIKARLIHKVECIPAKHILSAIDLEGVKQKSQVIPAIHVLYADDVVVTSDKAGSGRGQTFDQLWNVVVVVRNVKDSTGESSRAAAGDIIDATLKALQGWTPSNDHTALHRTRSSFRTTYMNGFVYFPLQFSTKMMTIGLGND